jgi:5-methylcytosine-specific restriction endonuclease McrA
MLERIRILTLDAYGTPTQWSDVEKYAYHKAKGNILWEMGEDQVILRGGHNKQAEQSLLSVPTIIAVKGKSDQRHRLSIALSKEALVMRDRHTCAYCGGVFKKDDLRMEHIFPDSRGGAFSWTNIVAACEPCNGRKSNRTPEEAKMPLLYVPYVPDRNEGLIMRNRNILADQMEFLMAGVQKKSRLHPGN